MLMLLCGMVAGGSIATLFMSCLQINRSTDRDKNACSSNDIKKRDK